jgi:predicted TIM-barrel fold metal-dependent hydrolase
MTVATQPLPLGPLIETHAHVYLKDHPVVADATHQPQRSFTTDDFLRTLDAHGVTFGVIAAASFLGSFNDYSLEATRTHRRLRTTVIVDPSVGPHALRAMAADGAVGIRFSLRNYANTPDLRTPEYQQLLRRIRDLDWHVHMYAEGDRLAALTPPLLEAGVKLVIDHYGNPDPRQGENSPGFQAALRALGSGRGWVKVSAPYRTPGFDHRALAARLLAEAGPGRLLFGSDWPFVGHEDAVTYRDAVTWFKHAIPDPAAHEQIGRTGLGLYGFI